MVLMNASKAARNQASIVNRTNTCGGGTKKSGLASTVGSLMSFNRGVNTQYGLICKPSTTIQTQKYGYHARLG